MLILCQNMCLIIIMLIDIVCGHWWCNFPKV